MAYDPETHHWRSVRLSGYDYRLAGAYFVTICTYARAYILGDMVGDEMRCSDWGRVAAACWKAIPAHSPRVDLDAFVVMPNHIHGIVLITADEGGRPRAGKASGELGVRNGPEGKASGGPGVRNGPEGKASGEPGVRNGPEGKASGEPGVRNGPEGKASGEPGVRNEIWAPDALPLRTASPAPSRLSSGPHGTMAGSLPAIVQNFKAVSARRINAGRGAHGATVWQRNYYEHVLRDPGELNRIRQYIADNPARWAIDEYRV